MAVWSACQNAPKKATPEQKNVAEIVRKVLVPFHQKMGKPKAGEWLATQKEEGQTFVEYIASRQADDELSKKWIVILPIGEFSPKQQEILDKSVAYLGTFYQLRTRILPAHPFDALPKKAVRQQGEAVQIHTGYVLNDLLLPKVRDSVACLLAFTAIDLYPYPTWNFVFGQASLTQRMGVWSMNRFGNPEQDVESYQTCLMHTIKTSIHEAGHIFGMRHCTEYVCCMSGSNNLEESANQPVMFCPVCTAKVGAHFQMNIAKQHEALAQFWKENNFPAEQAYYEKAGKLLKENLVK
jgi:archaemetzincin